jgi:PAS domain S-box-containing protein
MPTALVELNTSEPDTPERDPSVLQAPDNRVAQPDAELFRALVNGSREYAILMLDPLGFIVTWNAGAERITGYSASEIIGKHSSCLYKSDKIASGSPAKELKIALETGKYEEDAWRIRRDGTGFWSSLTYAPVFDAKGILLGFSVITRDITERKLVEQSLAASQVELTKRTEELQRLNSEADAFSYSVSHDLRAPLRHLDGFAELLLKQNRTPLDEKSQGYLEKIMVASKRMGRLIDDLLTFSRLSRSQVTRTSVNIRSLVEQTCVDLSPETEGRVVIWTLGDLPLICGDRPMMRVVLVNLLSNAVKYTSRRAEARIEIGSIPCPPDHVTLFVRDNGVGFDMEYAHKLFQVFQRLHSEEYEGTGIGLATVRRIVEHHGGRVWAEGSPENGAAFYMTLPAA